MTLEQALITAVAALAGVVVWLALYCRSLGRAIFRVQDQRVADARAHADSMERMLRDALEDRP